MAHFWKQTERGALRQPKGVWTLIQYFASLLLGEKPLKKGLSHEIAAFRSHCFLCRFVVGLF